MRKALTISAICILYCFYGVAQVTTTINDLYVPTSPGFVLLDKAPSSIEKPTSPKAFGITVLNAIKDNQGAIDVSPYWLWNHDTLSFEEALKQKSPVLQTLNLSAAISLNDTASYLSVGLRTQIYRCYSQKKMGEIKSVTDKIVDALSTGRADLIESTLKSLEKELGELRSQATLNIEAAAAMAGYSPNNKFSSLGNNRYGVWINVKWNPSYKAPFSVIGLVRYSKTVQSTEVSNQDSVFFDSGLALSYQKKSFDLQLEYVHRIDVSNYQAYQRTTLMANYMISDNVILVASFGKNFDKVQDIFAVFGIKFGLSTQRVSLN